MEENKDVPLTGKSSQRNCLSECEERIAQLFFSLAMIVVSIFGVLAIYDVAYTVERRENKSELIQCRHQTMPIVSKLFKDIEEAKQISKVATSVVNEKFLSRLKSYHEEYFVNSRNIVAEPVCSHNFIKSNDAFFEALRVFEIKLREGNSSEEFMIDAIASIDSLSDFTNNMNVLEACCVN